MTPAAARIGRSRSTADVSLEHGLAMADAIVYATAAIRGAELITSDRDFASLAGVTYLEK